MRLGLNLQVAAVNEADEDGLTPLHHAAARGQAEAVQFLIDNGALLSKSNDGSTPGDLAEGYPEVLSLLAGVEAAVGLPNQDVKEIEGLLEDHVQAVGGLVKNLDVDDIDAPKTTTGPGKDTKTLYLKGRNKKVHPIASDKTPAA